MTTSPTYHDLVCPLTGAIDAGAVFNLALCRARNERIGSARIGWHRKWSDVFPEALRQIEQTAHNMREAILDRQDFDAQTPDRRTVGNLMTRAEIAESAIPPRPDEAAELRARAERIAIPFLAFTGSLLANARRKVA